MKKRFIYILLIFLMCNCYNDDYNEDILLQLLYEQADERLLEYDAISEDGKQIMWNEEFDNNDSKFPLDISEYYGYRTITIEDGILIYNYDLTGPIIYEIPFTINEDNDFEIEVRILLNNSNDVIINDIINKGRYAFRYESDDEENESILIRDYSNLSRTFLLNNTQNYWNTNQFNILTIRRIGKRYSFFMNHKFLYFVSDNENTCDRAYIGISHGTNLYDYVRISYINN